MATTFKQSQQGAALLVSMLFLLVLTLIGVSAMSNSGMEANIAHNFQLNNTAFHAAETTIDNVLARSDRGSTQNPNPSYSAATDTLELASGGTPETVNYGDSDLDPSNFLGAATLTSGTTVTFIRFRPVCPGGGACNEYSITTTANINGTAATATHTQVVSFAVPNL